LRHNPISTRIECKSRTHDGGFLSEHGGERSKTTLAMKADAPLIKGPRQHHEPQGAQDLSIV
jgi:hypothetical protein